MQIFFIVSIKDTQYTSKGDNLCTYNYVYLIKVIQNLGKKLKRQQLLTIVLGSQADIGFSRKHGHVTSSLFSVPNDHFYQSNQRKLKKNAIVCGVSTGSTQFANVPNTDA